MGSLSKVFALILVLIIAISSPSLLMVNNVRAQTATASIHVPLIPQFTIKFVNASYIVTTTNAYTGQSETQEVSNNSIEIIIKNQPFDYSNNGLTYLLYYNIQIKPHFSTNGWNEVYPLIYQYSSEPNTSNVVNPTQVVSNSSAWYLSNNTQEESTTSETSMTFLLKPVALGYDLYYPDDHDAAGFMTVPTNAQLDFEVEALVGHDSEMWVIHLQPTIGSQPYPAVAYDSTSGWSNTQSINLSDGSVSISTSSNPILTPSPTLTPSPISTPTVPEFPSTILIITCLVAITLLGTIVIKRKQHVRIR